ncbi:MAG: hypothetical protein ABIO71_07215 [Caldimonas sp.]
MPTRLLARAAACLAAALLAACTAPGLLLTAAGVATDTSMTWDIVKHVHGKLVEDDPTPCMLLGSVQRAMNARCAYTAGDIKRADLGRSGLQTCPLAVATQDARLWRALPELMALGASVKSCPRSPLQDLAEIDACPDFTAAPAAVRQSLAALAENDPRAVRHDVFRMLSCPSARAAGLDRVLVGWLDRGLLEAGTLSFSPLGALHPELIGSRFARELEVAGHLPLAALDPYDGKLAGGFEEALRTSHWQALEWWLYRMPELANRVPPTRGGQLEWVPLQRVLLPSFLTEPSSQAGMVGFLMARGADPNRKLPYDPRTTVAAFARSIRSPMLSLLEPPAAPIAVPAKTALAAAAPTTAPR